METGKEVVKISLSNIIPNRFQPRISFDEEALNELANSIKMYGILQPLILRPLGDKYEIIAGERRYKAATIAGLSEVPAILVNLDDQTSAELAIIENIQRKDLTAIEEAKSYKKLLDLGNYTQDQLATKMGKSQSAIANKLRLLNLIPEAQEALMNNLISERHARSLLQLKDNPEKQREILNKITNERLTVKDTDNAIKDILGGMNMNEPITTPQTPVEQPVPTNIDVNNASDLEVTQTPVNDILNNTTPVEQSTINDNPNPTTEQPMDINIPNLNNDTFNLSQLSDPNFNVPSSPLNDIQPQQELNSTPSDFTIPTNNEPNEAIKKVPNNDFSVPDFDSLLQPQEVNEQVQAVETTPTPQFAPATAPTNKYFPDLEKETVNMNFANPFAQTTSKDLTPAINTTRQTIQSLESQGFTITTEESDLPDAYQITIKIKKDTTPTV